MIFTVCRSISRLGITFNLIPVINITEIVVSHVDRLYTAVCLTIICRGFNAGSRIILEPVFKMLIIASTIRLTIQINRICRTGVSTNAQRRHYSQTLELAVVLAIVTPAVLSVAATAKRASPESSYVCAILCRKSSSRYIARTPSCASSSLKCINITTITNCNNCRSIGRDRLCRGILEREVSRIKIVRPGAICSGCSGVHRDRTSGRRLLGHSSKI